jgi:hypothetical protein
VSRKQPTPFLGGAGTAFVTSSMNAARQVHLINHEYRIQMNHKFLALLLIWDMSGVCLVLLMRRHRLRLEAGFVW